MAQIVGNDRRQLLDNGRDCAGGNQLFLGIIHSGASPATWHAWTYHHTSARCAEKPIHRTNRLSAGLRQAGGLIGILRTPASDLGYFSARVSRSYALLTVITTACNIGVCQHKAFRRTQFDVRRRDDVSHTHKHSRIRNQGRIGNPKPNDIKESAHSRAIAQRVLRDRLPPMTDGPGGRRRDMPKATHPREKVRCGDVSGGR